LTFVIRHSILAISVRDGEFNVRPVHFL
jgi:hypothetical protein